MKVHEMGWDMWHASDINTYIVWWEHVKEGDYLGNRCVVGQIILKLMWKTWGDGGGGAFCYSSLQFIYMFYKL
jgi:hypothetical protein